jgi:hypothetical protein
VKKVVSGCLSMALLTAVYLAVMLVISLAARAISLDLETPGALIFAFGMGGYIAVVAASLVTRRLMPHDHAAVLLVFACFWGVLAAGTVVVKLNGGAAVPIAAAMVHSFTLVVACIEQFWSRVRGRM